MSDFRNICFGDVVAFFKNGTTATQVFFKTSKAVTRIETIASGAIDQTKLGYVSEQEDLERYRLEEGDILFSHINSIKHIGKTALVRTEAGIFNGMNLLQIRPNREKVDPAFLHELLSSDKVRTSIRRCSKQAVNQASISIGQLQEISLSLPPLPEQKKIAEILSGIQAEREAVNKEIQKVDHLERCLQETLLKEQEGWQKVSVSDLGRVIRGASPRPKGDPRYYGGNIPRLMVADVTRDGKHVTPRIDFLTEAGAKLSRPVPAGTLTIVCSGVVGVPSILSVDACIHDGFLAITDTTPDCMVEYLFYYFKPLQQILDSSATHGGIFTNLTTEILKDFPVTLPPLETQRKIVQKLRGIDAYRRALTSKISKVEFLLMSVSEDLLSGRKRVSV